MAADIQSLSHAAQAAGRRVAMRLRSLALAAIVGLMPLPASSAQASERIGVVLLHGKQSAPDQHRPLAEALAAAGHPVERPEMCWSERRIYDRPYLECLRELDAAIERLRRAGATAVVVAGHSLGANAALAYGARHPVKGVVALAPGHRPEALRSRPRVAASLSEAQRLIGAGRGAVPVRFSDYNGDLEVSVTATPVTYLSFFGPESPAFMPANAARLKAPLLYVVGSADPLQRGRSEIFDKAPPHPLNVFVTVDAGHFDTSAASAAAVTAWLARLSRRP
jgi:pimeloyl-ACP methyl ester carboxylesterase